MLKTGMRVVVKKGSKSFSTEGHHYTFSISMNDLIGKTFTVKRPFPDMFNCYSLLEDNIDYYWHENWLQPIGCDSEEFE